MLAAEFKAGEVLAALQLVFQQGPSGPLQFGDIALDDFPTAS
jgi:hypothetical protein